MLLFEGNHIKQIIQDRVLLEVNKLQVFNKDRIGLIGRNGSGKTTLLKIIAASITPDEGEIIQRSYSELLPQLKRLDNTKSGGEVTQEYIQQILHKLPQLLLADEPTTNLDISHVEWLERKLKNWQGAFIIVSHDRAFLDSLCTTIWEIEDGNVKVYKGNYSDYAKQKELEIQQQQSAYEEYEKEKKQLEEAIKLKEEKAQRATKRPKNINQSEGRIKGAKPYFAKKQKKLRKSAMAMETRLEKLEKVEKVKELPPIKMDLPNEQAFKGRIIIRAEKVSGKIGKRTLWGDASFFIRGGEKLAIIGPNGCGKTTLVKKIINHEQGISISPSVKIGYFSQNLNILDKGKSILANVKSSSKQDETLIRTVLARLHFYNQDVYKTINVLSGGERVKVALAKIFVSDMNTLILDEPTNFLDVEALEALEGLMKGYEGSIIFVSHDRQFIKNIATRILEIRNNQLTLFEGTYEQFKEHQSVPKSDTQKTEHLVLDTKISEVLSKLSVEPTEALEKEFQRLMHKKKKLDL